MKIKLAAPLAALLLLCGVGYLAAFHLMADSFAWVMAYLYFGRCVLPFSGSFLAVWFGRKRLLREHTKAARRIFCLAGLAPLGVHLAVMALALTVGLRPPAWVTAALFHPLLWLLSGVLLGMGVDRPQG